MFANNITTNSGNKKNVRYEPIERRKTNRRNVTGDRREEQRADHESKERRQTTERRKK